MPKYIQDNRRWGRRKKGHGLATVAVVLLGGFIILELVLMSMEIKARQGRPGAPVVEVAFSAPLTARPDQRPGPGLDKKELADLIGSRSLGGEANHLLEISDRSGQALFVRTTLLPDLQDLSDAWVRGSRARQAALVVLNPDNGEVLTLAGYRDDGEEKNAALAGSFPAASLFKIVTAAAAVEKAELSADSKLAYDGGKHTLYKNNLAKEPDQGRQVTTLEASFAESINSVFGKLGASTLGPEELADIAGRFGFNHDIDFEMPVEVSSFSVDGDDEFHLAELASGFNRSTKVSPLHGAMIAATVVGGGILYDPSMVREVFDRENRIHYRAEPARSREIISPKTAAEMTRMMRLAVEEGTGRRVLGAAAREHPILSRLIIGGKSGTINNDQGQRVDWFVAWAQPKPGTGCQDRLALSAVVVHDGQTTTTSQRLIRDALAAYYKNRLNGSQKKSTTTAGRSAS